MAKITQVNLRAVVNNGSPASTNPKSQNGSPSTIKSSQVNSVKAQRKANTSSATKINYTAI